MRKKDEADKCLTRVESDSTASVGPMAYDVWERSGGRHRVLLESGPTATHQANEDRWYVTLMVNALNVGAQFCGKRFAKKTFFFPFYFIFIINNYKYSSSKSFFL